MELGEVIQTTKPAFVVIGKEGQGPIEDSTNWVSELWKTVYQDLDELNEYVDKKDQEADLWGLMSDSKRWLEPWQEQGKYLAGIELAASVQPPDGWQRWEMPAMKYLVVKTDAPNLETMTQKMFEEILPKEQQTLVGAIQEHYLPKFATGEVELYFPVEIL
ncbi:GyrI-like domain-containing protein [Tetragenococcus solitarius]|uniref:AraC effector-binding domain-containing protein n=1 Tax=Tetragenococcus solitarius TaxID=71453 RepID=A0ABN3Y8Z1_9ENTE|nr:GyrI-like domain-containing protein [Tetragenococcus solitarius]